MVASPFLRIQEDTEPLRVIPPRSLRPSDFLVGNPGIQGSNLVCRLSALLEAGLFDESLPSCTDRGLCNRTPQDPAPMPGKLRELLASGAVDVAIGACTGAPPLPFAPTERVQLVDPVAPLQWFSVLDPNEGPVRSQPWQRNAAVRALHHCWLDQIRSPRPRNVRSCSEHEPDNDRANTPTTTPIDGLSYLSSDSAG